MRAFVRKERLLVALLVFAAAFFAYRWAVDLQRPGAQTEEGWRGFTDQGAALRAKGVKVGDPVTATCKVAGQSDNFMQLTDCAL